MLFRLISVGADKEELRLRTSRPTITTSCQLNLRRMSQILKEALRDANQLTTVIGREGFRLTSTKQPEKIWTKVSRGIID